ncbi:hypothetical protein [Tsuneonella mangrovi]|uniref:hypothetical protein n=1 Tax=Tsuneonella mangrovi TaxID=1982042 RepID=UPI001F0A603E|nr:hypothetical protein [Tsuneonella mangrovi]
MNIPESPLDDPVNAAHAFAHYRRMMKWMAAFTALVVALVLAGFWLVDGATSIHFYIATGLGIGFTMMLTGALMGLLFLSNGTGHDESVVDPLAGEEWPGKLGDRD